MLILACLAPALAVDTVVVVGGGAEQPGGWSDPLFEALAAGRTVAVLGATESDEPGFYRDYLVSLGALSADEYVVPDRAAAQGLDLGAYDAFFLRGGDQWEYISQWAGTPVEDAILAAAAVGGTSAGAAVLGEWDYTAERGTVYPEEVLADCGSPFITFDDVFLPLLPGVMTDTHFTQRGRLGRLLSFAAMNGVVGLGVDDTTGVVVEGDTWTVYGTATATVVTGGRSRCDGGPPFVDDAHVDVLTEGWTWDAATRTATGPGATHAAVYHRADATLATGDEGAMALSHLEADSLYCGTLELWPGRGEWPGLVVPDAFEETTVEARVGGAVWALAQAGLPGSVILPAGVEVQAAAAGGFTATGESSAVVLLAESGLVGPERGWQDPECENPRLARALTGIRATVLPPDGTVAFADAGEASGGDSGADSGDTGDTSGDTGDTSLDGDDAPDDTASGCGCAAPGGHPAPPWLPLALALGVLARARRPD